MSSGTSVTVFSLKRTGILRQHSQLETALYGSFLKIQHLNRKQDELAEVEQSVLAVLCAE